MAVNDSAKANEIKPRIAGTATNIIALRRPIESDTKPLAKLPNGCPIVPKLAVKTIELINLPSPKFLKYSPYLPSHDASIDVMRIVSFGFRAVLMPSNDGIIIDGQASNRLLLKIIRFLTIVTST